MGLPTFASQQLHTTLEESDVPISEMNKENASLLPKRAVLNAPLLVDGIQYDVTCVGVGNPHCVVFSKFVDKEPLETLGPLFENHAAFPNRTNTEFVRVAGPNELKMRTWERGNGETCACGTGACAAAIASVLNGFCPINLNITVRVRG